MNDIGSWRSRLKQEIDNLFAAQAKQKPPPPISHTKPKQSEIQLPTRSYAYNYNQQRLQLKEISKQVRFQDEMKVDTVPVREDTNRKELKASYKRLQDEHERLVEALEDMEDEEFACGFDYEDYRYESSEEEPPIIDYYDTAGPIEVKPAKKTTETSTEKFEEYILTPSKSCKSIEIEAGEKSIEIQANLGPEKQEENSKEVVKPTKEKVLIESSTEIESPKVFSDKEIQQIENEPQIGEFEEMSEYPEIQETAEPFYPQMPYMGYYPMPQPYFQYMPYYEPEVMYEPNMVYSEPVFPQSNLVPVEHPNSRSRTPSDFPSQEAPRFSEPPKVNTTESSERNRNSEIPQKRVSKDKNPSVLIEKRDISSSKTRPVTPPPVSTEFSADSRIRSESPSVETSTKPEVWEISISKTSNSEKHMEFENRAQKRVMAKPVKKGKTKEELLEIRKAMLKPKTIPKKEVMDFKFESPSTPISGPNPELLERLSNGIRPKITKKEMQRLTAKHYNNLPEVKKREQEEIKKQELRDRRERARIYDQQRRFK